jgi:hypothetical protein
MGLMNEGDGDEGMDNALGTHAGFLVYGLSIEKVLISPTGLTSVEDIFNVPSSPASIPPSSPVTAANEFGNFISTSTTSDSPRLMDSEDIISAVPDVGLSSQGKAVTPPSNSCTLQELSVIMEGEDWTRSDSAEPLSQNTGLQSGSSGVNASTLTKSKPSKSLCHLSGIKLKVFREKGFSTFGKGTPGGIL